MEQRLRAILFYTSAISFFILLPVVLLYSFGYRLDISKFRFIKTGLIYVKTQPDGAAVFLNGRPLKKTSPVVLDELLPGKYKIAAELQSYFPWQQTVTVESGKTTSLENIILFARKPHLKKINLDDVNNFYIFPSDKGHAYYVSEAGATLSRSQLNSKVPEVDFLCGKLDLPDNIKEVSLSEDKKKIFYFTDNRLDVIYLPSENIPYEQTRLKNFFITSNDRIMNAFWYSDSEHIIAITGRDIRIYELSGQGKNSVTTVLNLNDKKPKAFYNSDEDILYFTDLQIGPDKKLHRGLYRMEMNKNSPLPFIKNLEDNFK